MKRTKNPRPGRFLPLQAVVDHFGSRIAVMDFLSDAGKPRSHSALNKWSKSGLVPDDIAAFLLEQRPELERHVITLPARAARAGEVAA